MPKEIKEKYTSKIIRATALLDGYEDIFVPLGRGAHLG